MSRWPWLIQAQRKAEVELGVVQLLVGFDLICREQVFEPIGAVPAIQRLAAVFGVAQVAEPDAAFGRQLAQVGAPVGREDEGNAVFRLSTPVAIVKIYLCARREGAAVALGLLQGP